MELEKKTDERGWLVELFREELEKGQVYMFTIQPGKIRGGHYHERKTEAFCIPVGKVKLTLKDTKTGKQEEILCDGSAVEKISVPPYIGHTFENIGETEAIVIAYIDEKFSEKDPDTHYL